MTIDPQKFGELVSDVKHIKARQSTMDSKLDQVLETHHQHKGMMRLAGFLWGIFGGIVGALGSRFAGH